MRRLWRLALLVVFALVVVSGADWLSRKEPETEQQGEVASEKFSAKAKERQAKMADQAVNRLVPLFPAGSFEADSSEARSKAPGENSPSASKARSGKTRHAVRGKGQRPVLEVSYDGIGFERYLDVISWVGRFFVLLRARSGVALGPEVSFQHGILVPRSDRDVEVLAIGRPHLVSDAKIRARLATMRLPKKALDDRVVLVLTKPFDAELWEVIRKSAAKRGLALDEIALIKGAYVKARGGIFLRLDKAVTRTGKHEVALNRRLRISL